MRINFHPTYAFASPATPAVNWFAWKPVRYWWGEWVWLRVVSRQLQVTRTYLDGPTGQFWSYCHREGTE